MPKDASLQKKPRIILDFGNAMGEELIKKIPAG
jgi:hypothetical protein